MSRAFVLLHGWQNHREPDHWHHWLHDQLVARGFVVRYPQLPDPDMPSLDAWIDAHRTELAGCGTAEVTVVCHFSTTDGYGPWPRLLDWCLEPSTLPSADVKA